MLDISDFKEWLKNPFTEELINIVTIEKKLASECVLYSSSENMFKDQSLHEILYLKGCIRAYDELLSVNERGDELLVRINERLKNEKR